MALGDDTSPNESLAPFDQLQHDLKIPLTTIHGRTQLLTQYPALAIHDRGGARADARGVGHDRDGGTRGMAATIDAMGREGGDGRPAATGDGEHLAS